jgi:hypothetical protein
MGIWTSNNTDVLVENVMIAQPEDSGRWLGINSDGLHFRSSRGTLTVKNTLVRNAADDASNVHTTRWRVRQISADRRTVVVVDAKNLDARNRTYHPRPGDVFTAGYASNKIKNNGSFELASFSEIPQDPLGQNDALQLVFEAAVPNQLAVDDYLTNLTQTPTETLYDGFRAIGNRAQGMLIQSSNTTVVNSEFRDMSGGHIKIFSDDETQFKDGIAPSNVVIKNNVFGFGNHGNSKELAALYIGGLLARDVFADSSTMGDIFICGNTFESTPSPSIFIASATNVVLAGNNLAGAVQINEGSTSNIVTDAQSCPR